MSPGQIEDLESEESKQNEELSKDPTDVLERIEKLVGSQSKAILLLTGKLAELEGHQDQTDAAIIEVAKKAGGGGGGSNLLAQLIPLLKQNPGPSPLEKVAMQSFMRNIAFASLTTERLAKKQFGDEYTKMIKSMEEDMAGKNES